MKGRQVPHDRMTKDGIKGTRLPVHLPGKKLVLMIHQILAVGNMSAQVMDTHSVVVGQRRCHRASKMLSTLPGKINRIQHLSIG